MTEYPDDTMVKIEIPDAGEGKDLKVCFSDQRGWLAWARINGRWRWIPLEDLGLDPRELILDVLEKTVYEGS